MRGAGRAAGTTDTAVAGSIERVATFRGTAYDPVAALTNPEKALLERASRKCPLRTRLSLAVAKGC
jgi:hypothetical protein